MLKNKKGFAVAELLIILIVIAAIAGAGFYVFKKDKKDSTKSSGTVSWQRSENGWMASGTPPACPSPLTVTMPTDISKVVGILYPGQYRGGNYKPHGGLKFGDNLNDTIEVKLPSASRLYKGSRYIEQGETQYLLAFIDPCGIMYKYDHLYTLTPAFQKVVDENFPPAKEDYSQTTDLTKDLEYKAGETIATSVGFKKTGNTSFDFGVYDLRSKNEISKNSTWAAQHSDDNEYAPYAVCWLDLLGKDSAKIKTLPAVDGKSAAISDYCKTSNGNTLTNTVGNP